MINSTYINGIKVYVFEDKDILLKYIKDKKKILISINSEIILKDDVKLKKIIKKNIGYADGVGTIMALRQKGYKAVKIPGAELWLNIIEKYYNVKSFYLIGATQDIVEKTVAKLKKEFPNINITGFRNGFLGNEDKKYLINELKTKKPDIIFVAQGCPMQEFLMDEMIKEHPALYLGLGGSFDIYSGFKKRAPKLFIRLHLEWLYRLMQEPSRVGRQLILFKFLYLLMRRKL